MCIFAKSLIVKNICIINILAKKNYEPNTESDNYIFKFSWR